MDKKLNSIINKLQMKGYRNTKSRIEIIKLFLNTTRHLNIKDIYDTVKNRDISQATVYRTVDILKNNDIIKEIIIKNKSYYELKISRDRSIYIHLRCEKCEKIIDIWSDKILYRIAHQIHNMENTKNVDIKELSIIINGICEDCKRREHYAKTNKTKKNFIYA